MEIVRYLKAAEYSEASALADDSILPFNITIQFNSAMGLYPVKEYIGLVLKISEVMVKEF